MLQALSAEVTEMSYASIIREFGLEDASVEERIETLRTASPENLVSKTPMSVPLLPFLDGDIVPEQITFTKLASKDHTDLSGVQWCEQLMIGDCQHDGTVFHFQSLAQWREGIATRLCTSLHSNLPMSCANAVLQAYNITPSTPDDDAMQNIFDLATDIAYTAPALAYACSFPGKTYAYHFNEPNPWDGMFTGKCTHMLDAAFLFQHFNEHMKHRAQRVAKELAFDFIMFANGVQPWAEFEHGEGKARTYGPSEKSIVGVVDVHGWGNGRRHLLWKLSEKGEVDIDEVIVAWNMFIAGR
jgi:hypothetical protein